MLEIDQMKEEVNSLGEDSNYVSSGFDELRDYEAQTEKVIKSFKDSVSRPTY